MLAFLLVVQTQAPAPPRSKCAILADSAVAAVDSTGDRAASLARRVYHDCDNDFDALFTAGRGINHAATFKGTQRNYNLRTQARNLLDRAVLLHPRDAVAWLELGTLLRKIGGVQVDAQRALRKALQYAEQYPDSARPALMAALDLQRARISQDLVDRERWLKSSAGLGVNTPTCNAIGAFCQNYTHPALFNQQLKDAPTLGTTYESARQEVLRLYGKALREDSTNAEAAEALARELALGDEWDPLAAFAAATAARGVEAPYFRVVAALAEDRLGHFTHADSMFDQAVPELPDSLRRWFERPPSGLDSLPDFWTRVRPLWVVPYDELRLEYRTRVAYALLVLRDREAEVAGPETPVGDALLRYGWPVMITQVELDPKQLMSLSQESAVDQFLSCTGADAGGGSCEPPPGTGNPMGGPEGGRWLFWTYAMDRPSMIFERQPGARVARYLRNGQAEGYAAQERAKTPMTFASRIAPRQYQLPVQVARFRSDVPGATTFAFYGLVPSHEMQLPAADVLTTGLLIFRDTTGFPPAARQVSEFAAGDELALTYRVPLGPGRYWYSVEAFSPQGGAAARTRDSVVAPAWNADSLQMSDLLIAHQVQPKADAATLTWQDLLVQPSRTLTVAPGATVWIVWETYGLTTGPRGTASYDVSLALEDTAAKPLPLRLLARQGPSKPVPASVTTLQWTSERPLSPDGRALEYVSIALPPEATGDYRLRVTIKDANGRTATAERAISVLAPAPAVH